MCSWSTVWESSYIPLFCGRDTFHEVVRRPENTHEELTGLVEWPARLSLHLRDQRISLFRIATSRSLPQSKFTDLILSFLVPCGSMNILFTHVFFCSWLVIGTYILPGFFPVICWSYLRTEISVTQSIGNKSYSLSCETTLLMLSCDRIEPAKFIVES